jgi:hypothetical protein
MCLKDNLRLLIEHPNAMYLAVGVLSCVSYPLGAWLDHPNIGMLTVALTGVVGGTMLDGLPFRYRPRVAIGLYSLAGLSLINNLSMSHDFKQKSLQGTSVESLNIPVSLLDEARYGSRDLLDREKEIQIVTTSFKRSDVLRTVTAMDGINTEEFMKFYDHACCRNLEIYNNLSLVFHDRYQNLYRLVVEGSSNTDTWTFNVIDL